MSTPVKARRFLALTMVVLGFIGTMVWANSRNPFERIEFTLHLPGGQSFKGMALLPKPLRPRTVVVFLHGLNGSLSKDGESLRQLAELGVAAVGLDYNQSNQAAFDAQFLALNRYLALRPWAESNAVAWIGFSLGAQRSLGFAVRHPEIQPQVLARISGGWIPELDEIERETNKLVLKYPVLLIHGERDYLFPSADVHRLAKLLQRNGGHVARVILAERSHALDADWPLAIRLAGEYCKGNSTPDHPWPEFPVWRSYPFWLCELPAFVLAAGWFWFKKRREGEKMHTDFVRPKLTGPEIVLRITAVVVAGVAAADTALHWVLPHLRVTESSLVVARRLLLAPKWHDDFETLAAQPIWEGQELKVLLEHVELANYAVNDLVNWKLDDDIYRRFVLSPVIVGGERELRWRRDLWESFYPRIRHESTTEAAAQIVARFLREWVTIAPDYPRQPGVETMWRARIVNSEDFEIIYTAALRSVAVPARLNASWQTDFWTGTEWQAAPRPALETWDNFEK